MQHSGFFNALIVGNTPDRRYNADDYRDNLATIISSGVLRSTNDDLKVTASGMVISVGIGRAWIKGGYYLNDSTYSFPAITAPVGGARYDRVILRFDNDVDTRSIELVYRQGTPAENPQPPALVRSGNIYELCLANIHVALNATSVTVYDTREDNSVCGWVYSVSGDNSFFTSLDSSFNTWFQEKKNTLSSVTLFKRYTWSTTLAAASSSVTFTIPQWDADTCFLEVYVNGILDSGFTQSGTTLTFDGTLVAGTKVTVNVYKSIDGTGIQTVAGEITQLQNDVNAIKAVARFTYDCTGTNDNISLSQIAQAILDGTYTAGDLTAAASAFLTRIGGLVYLAALPSNAKITIEVAGNLGATTPYAGSGTAASRYRWFSFGQIASTEKEIIFDYEKCNAINLSCAANTESIIFYGTDLHIRNARVVASNATNAAGVAIQMIAGSYETGDVEIINCDFKIVTSGLAKIAENGDFINCDAWIASSADHALCFTPTTNSYIRVIGGSFYAYITASGKTSAIFYTYGTETNAVIMAYNISAPTVSETGRSQGYLSVGYAGKTYINGVVSTQITQGTYNEIVGQVWKSKR